jgi:hypothetical protein
VQRNDHRYALEWSSGSCEVEVRINGEISFDHAARRIESLSPGGTASFVETGHFRRQVDVRRLAAGLEYRWSVDGAPRAFGADARAWLSEMVAQFLRQTGYGRERAGQQIDDPAHRTRPRAEQRR